jgi:DNA (cytosine-5)-methyltransferase 1
MTLPSHHRGPAAIRAYYNEIDPFAADWIRALMAHGLIASGDVDTRSITDVRPSDLRGYTQCHFFAGIGGWSYALRQAGWDDTRPVWTGSCPCQPFSLAGKQKGFDDDRHLWPVWRELIRECAPAVVFGEQVASATEWLGLVRSDLEAMGRAVGAMPIQAASAGADHLRDRYWFVAHTDDARSQGWKLLPECAGERSAGANGLAYAARDDQQRDRQSGTGSEPQVATGGLRAASDMGDGESYGRHVRARQAAAGLLGAELDPADADSHDMADSESLADARERLRAEPQRIDHSDAKRGDGSGELSWVTGADGKARRVKSGIRLLAHGVPNRVGTLRGFGNAIDYRPAKEFIGAFIDTMRAPALSSKNGVSQ